MNGYARTVRGALPLAMPSLRGLLALGCIAIIWLASALPAEASLRHPLIGPFGTASQPSFIAVGGIAVDGANGDLLVIDRKAKTISRYHVDGSPADFSALGTNVLDAKGNGECPSAPQDCDQTPQNGFRFGEYPGEEQVTVDSSGTVTDGDIYVTQGVGNLVHVVDIFASTGNYLGQLTAAGATPFAQPGEEEGLPTPCGVAVGVAGELYVAGAKNDRIFKYQPAANPPVNGDFEESFATVAQPCSLAAGSGPTAGALFANSFFTLQKDSVLKINGTSGLADYVVDPLEDRLVAVDSLTGHVYALGEDEFVREFDASGGTPKLFSSSQVAVAPNGIAARGERLYVASGSQVYEYGPPVIVPDVETSAAVITGNTSATLTGTVAPGGIPVDECVIEYGTSTAYGLSAPCAETPAEIGAGVAPVPVHADVAGLELETLYHYRVIARNENATIKAKDRTFQTPTKPIIVEEQTAAISPSSARISAKVNPGNALTSVYFEWGPTAAYGQTTPATTEDSKTGEPLGDDTAHMVEFTLPSLAAGTSYHWRVVAGNSLGTVIGSDRSFETYAAAATGLPDHRAYELVSPAAKGSADFAIPTVSGGLSSGVKPLQSSPDGMKITYPSFTAVGDEVGGAPATSQYLSSRVAAGWGTQNITPRSEEGGIRDPLVGFASDLSQSVLIVPEPALTSDASTELPNLYLRDNGSGALTALTKEPPAPEIAVLRRDYCLLYGGASADFNRVVFSARGALRPSDPVGLGFNLYEWTPGGGLELLSRLPNGSAAVPHIATGIGSLSGEQFCASQNSLMRNAVSADGGKIFWTYEGAFQGASNPLLARLIGPSGSSSIRLDAPNTGAAAPGGDGEFWDASKDGERVFFTDIHRLTQDSTAGSGSPDLYRYDFAAPAGAKLTDLTAGGGEPANVHGVVGASDDGSYVYFVARGVITEAPNSRGAEAVTGAENLYVWHDGLTSFVAVASQSSATDNPATQTARVTPDGQHLAFTSSATVTGFDNRVLDGTSCTLGALGENTLVSGPQCEEVFLFDYQGKALTCGSCSPANANPQGPSRVPPWSTPYQQPRYLSDDGGRLLFDTLDSLTPQDKNGRRDVYEFERPGFGTCATGSSSYSGASGGCVYLLSSGESSDESYLLDASSSGSDIFISTRTKLSSADEDEQFDVYDVRVDGSTPAPAPAECVGEQCRPWSPVPAPSSPASSRLSGPGNPTPRKHCPKGKRRVVKGGKARCVRRRGGQHRRTRHRADRKPEVNR